MFDITYTVEEHNDNFYHVIRETRQDVSGRLATADAAISFIAKRQEDDKNALSAIALENILRKIVRGAEGNYVPEKYLQRAAELLNIDRTV